VWKLLSRWPGRDAFFEVCVLLLLRSPCVCVIFLFYVIDTVVLTLEYGVSQLHGHPEDPQSCQQDARRSTRTLDFGV
jgi:hypothetical protein